MRIGFVVLLMGVVLATLSLRATAQQEMSRAEDPEDMGKTAIGRTYFPIPEGVTRFDVPNGTFEDADNGAPAVWLSRHFTLVENGAPEGKRYAAFAGGEAPYRLELGNLTIAGNRPHLLSMWARTTESVQMSVVGLDVDDRWGMTTWLTLPSTEGQWRRVGFYFRPIHGATQARLQFFKRGRAEVAPFALDDVRLRTATEDEYTRAYTAWRAQYPARDLSPRPTDGQNLALSIRKLDKGFEPNRPFLIWAIGSSYTNALGMGDTIRQMIYERFGHNTEVVYRKNVGSAVSFRYIRGWYNHLVAMDQPDMVLIYTIGSPNDLERLIQDIRRTSTADIVVPSMHWRIRDIQNWGKSENAADQDVARIREVCKNYGVEFVESRREWAEFMVEHNMEVEVDPKGLLRDAVHQSDYGALIINENIGRHFARPREFNYNPDERERRLVAIEPRSIRPNEGIELKGNWVRDGDRLTTAEAGASLTVTFQGSRIDLIGVTVGGGGSVSVLVDGKSAAEAPAFFRTFIEPGPNNARPDRGRTTDRSPHGIELGQNVVPQDWTIRMLDDEGRYEVVGSVTGRDGEGTVFEDFVSRSGQIIVPIELWRNRVMGRGPGQGNVVNKEGDIFTFTVVRAVEETVSFDGGGGESFRARLVQNINNAEHTLTLVADGNGPISVRAFDVFEPPLK